MGRIEEIREREAKATAGEWYWENNLLLTNDPKFLVMKPFYDDDTGEVMTCIFQNDAEFIAHSRADIPFLLAEIERLTKERDAAVKDIMCNDHCDVCVFGKEFNNECHDGNFDCVACKSETCKCRDCRNENKWQCRGIETKGDE